MGCSSSQPAPPQEFFKVGNRVAAVKLQHVRRFRNPHTGEMEDTLFGAAWSPGIVTAVNEVQVMAKRYDRGSAYKVARQAQANKTSRVRKYTVTFDTGDCEADVPVDRIRADASPAPARPPGAAATEAARV